MNKITKSDLIAAIILTLVMAFMEMSALPAALFCNIRFQDIDPIYFALMLNFIMAFILCGRRHYGRALFAGPATEYYRDSF